MCRLLCYFYVLFLCLLHSYSQNRFADSLNRLYAQSKSDTQKISLLKQMAWRFHATGKNSESIKCYGDIITKFGKKYPKNALDAKNEIAFENILLEEYAKADTILKEVLEESVRNNYPKGIGFANRYMGLLNVYTGEFKKATDYYLRALEIWEQSGDATKISMGFSDLGINFYYQENYKKAAYYWENCIKNTPDKTTDGFMNNCTNLGQAYVELGKFDEAIELFKKATGYYSENKKSTSYTNALTGIANIEYKRKNYVKALGYYTEIIKLREGFNTRNNDLATTYLNVSLIYSELNKNKEALEYAIKGYERAKDSEDMSELLHAYNNLNTVYAKNGNFEKAYEFSQLYNVLRDSLNNIENQKQINELDKKYQTEKKEKDNQLLNKQIEIQNIQGKQQELYLIISVIILIMIGFLAAILFRQNKQKQEVNLQLSQKNKIIEEQHKDITDSIKYAQRIQQAILPPDKMWYELLPDSFILYKPKDILSGDFYWVERKQGHIFVAAADCTGHGVPGAIMSVVNTNLLNKAVLEQHLVKPSAILNAVNQWLTIALHQSFNESAVRDGMDIALCAINMKTKHLQFAGAFNGAYLFKKDGSFIELNGDKMPVGAFIEEKMQQFSDTEMNLEAGDRLYIFSDGYADQFGGPKGKKLKYKKLKQYMEESLHMSMPEQKKYLDNKFEEWKGNYEQVDDVLLIGITI